ncbi:twin-arginine translocation signal domain-containing protein [Streptomyces hawaiiensis]|uniref:twin-arginine translocation signal domain-containing protein n=1 Tax=Streptomyces hawaiiensis TaxID=67305 RepID=UPI001FE399C6|nr:twin-arginine translocation signal domain-containing protein [Streptomyces hawaiiensis]
MTMQRRSFLTLSATGAAGVGISLLGTGQAAATARAGAPTQRFAVGVRQYAWSRGNRRWTTDVYYPATGRPPVTPR